MAKVDPADYTCHRSCMQLNGCQRCDECPDWQCASVCDAASCTDDSGFVLRATRRGASKRPCDQPCAVILVKQSACAGAAGAGAALSDAARARSAARAPRG
jgi:hypothetical protein